jgi:RNA polymerase sigma-70 factor (ECF subfamily)
VRIYGPEILGFLLAILRDEELAREVYSDWMEDVCRGLAGFRWQCTFRTWAYMLARHAWHRTLARAEGPGTVPLSDAPEVAARAVRERTPTLPYLRTDLKKKVARLREGLAPDDQELLILRVDRGLAWLEIAEVMLGPGGPRRSRARETEAAALRKRFERVKERLRDLARREKVVVDE